MHLDFSSHGCSFFIGIDTISCIDIHYAVVRGCKFSVSTNSCPCSIDGFYAATTNINVRCYSTYCFIRCISFRICFSVCYYIYESVDSDFRMFVYSRFGFDVSVHCLDSDTAVFGFCACTDSQYLTFQVFSSVIDVKFSSTVGKESGCHAAPFNGHIHGSGIFDVNFSRSFYTVHRSNRGNSCLSGTTCILHVYIQLISVHIDFGTVCHYCCSIIVCLFTIFIIHRHRSRNSCLDRAEPRSEQYHIPFVFFFVFCTVNFNSGFRFRKMINSIFQYTSIYVKCIPFRTA